MLADLARVLTDLAPTQTFVLVDANTARHCLPVVRATLPVLAKAEVITVPAGEARKTIATCGEVWDRLLDARADRRAAVVCLGGGVVTDLGGFAAASYKRGIRFVHVPTTLLAMVDAALGGKTGVDHGGVKNSVGAFRMPEAVVTDPRFLATLPPRELRSGFAEMLKHALICDPRHWDELKALPAELPDVPQLPELIARSQQIKLDLVAVDPHDRGPREALNFGHSIGHALESVLLGTDHPALHGEAVAAGMICEAYLSQARCGLPVAELADLETALLARYGKLRLRANHIATALALVSNDKKNRGGQSRMSLLRRIGEPRLGVTVSPDDIERALERYLALPA